MFVTRAGSGRRSARAVVAAWLIALQVLLTASIGTIFCGAGFASDDVSESKVATSPLSPSSTSSSEDYVTAAVAAAGEAATAIGGIELEVAVLDVMTGELASGAKPATPMLSASLSKLFVAVDIIDRRRDEGLVVEDSVLDLIRQALGPSDDFAMNELWTGFDGIGAVDRVARRLGLAGTVAPDDPSTWGEVTIAAADMALVYRHVLRMPQPDRDLILDALAAAPVVAADGFEQDFGLLAPSAIKRSIAKQGWMCCWGQASYLHSAGLVDDGRFVVVLLSRQELQEDWQPERDRLTVVADTVNDVLSASVNVGS